MAKLEQDSFAFSDGRQSARFARIRRWRRVRAAIAQGMTIGFALLLAGTVLVANSGRAESLVEAMGRIPGGDKVFHVVTVGGLAFLLNLTLAGKRVHIGPLSFFVSTLALVPLVTVEEISQLWVNQRVFSLADLVCNYLGIVVFGWLAVCWRSKPTTGWMAEAPTQQSRGG